MRIYGLFVALAAACVLSACDEPMFITDHGELGLDATELSLDPLHDPPSRRRNCWRARDSAPRW
ncbi:MAG: hypothetical protein IPK74_39705 [Deltaproteobacteria bacterium]|nr:hypothetical protein [Deltaproteobacteria bacterium]